MNERTTGWRRAAGRLECLRGTRGLQLARAYGSVSGQVRYGFPGDHHGSGIAVAVEQDVLRISLAQGLQQARRAAGERVDEGPLVRRELAASVTLAGHAEEAH
ncbi:hypothetical protein [Streptomyces lasiicapitis]|uniref:Uncharacterized protein n=1 Tax=Streptomyces lasiicapitis TaxID=1923961 RepID=A0ABQ2LIF0_9ACTN|nr:hypothetical protein [Streptomyces lasiicapitis]GGO35477.1 hypothetical protein GCM10012286_06200 [Streptomyces lasiicapitis]